ncbi:MAG: ATP-binding cassette domain-containing protein [Clostridia bacterium]|nr:ATP-binding cassette domain-containing protein [Clostridia bacterium]
MNSVELKKLSKTFGSRKAVDELSLSIKSGTVFGLLGQNGAGKTTTIKMLCGLLSPSSGNALIEGKSVLSSPQEVKKLVSISPQETAAAKKLTAFENHEFIAEIYGAKRCDAKKKAEEMLGRFSLSDRANEKAKSLSGGMARRLSIAMALINEPKVLFLDEPTLGLDVRARRDLWKVIEELKGKMTVILTTHYLEEAEALCDEIGIMNEGKLRALGTAKEISEKADAKNFEDAFLFFTDPQKEEER